MAARIGLGFGKAPGRFIGVCGGDYDRRVGLVPDRTRLQRRRARFQGNPGRHPRFFLLGCAGMLGLDKLVPHQHMDEESPEGSPSHLSRPMLLVLAVALHNIPEGLALGVVIAAAMADAGMTWTAAIVFGLGLALQNFPEGMAVVLPPAPERLDEEALCVVGLLGQPGRAGIRPPRRRAGLGTEHPWRGGDAGAPEHRGRRYDLHRRRGAHPGIPGGRPRPRRDLRLSHRILDDGGAGYPGRMRGPRLSRPAFRFAIFPSRRPSGRRRRRRKSGPLYRI